MRSSVFLEYASVLLLLLLVVIVDSQGLSTIDYGSRETPSGCKCVPIRRCPPALRQRIIWMTERCEQGLNQYRRVCCPLPRTPPPKIHISKLDAVCGQSIKKNLYKPLLGAGDPHDEWWPWMAAIRIRIETGYYAPWCSGFLIDRRHIISAAHCYERRGYDLYRARIGSFNQTESDEYRIIDIAVPKGYVAGMFYDDIAVLTLNREVNFTDFNPVCLTDEPIGNMSLIGRGTTVSGWRDGGYVGAEKNILQSVYRLPVVSNSKCQRILREKLRDSFQREFPKGLSKGFICTAIEESNYCACEGYSGGPLMFKYENRWFAIGVVSFGLTCRIHGLPVGYTRISNYLDWIEQNIRN